MKQFMEPDVKVELFRIEDVITTSNFEEDPTPGGDGTPISPM